MKSDIRPLSELRMRGWHLLCVGYVIALFIYFAVITPYIGVVYDDARYVALAQALAHGWGFTQVAVPDHPPESQYPPGWPFLLSPIWILLPQFPENAPAFKCVSVLCGFAFVALGYGWMRWRGVPEWQRAAIALLMLFNPSILGLAISALSEMAYAAFSILALWLVERLGRQQNWRRRDVLIAAATVAMTVYVRAYGLTLGLAVAIVLIKQNWRKGFVFAGLVFLFLLPLGFHSLSLSSDSNSYSQQFLLRSLEQPELGTITLVDLLVRVILNMRAYLLAGLPGAVLPSQVPLTYVNLNEDLRLGAPFPGFDILLAILISGGILGKIVWQRSISDVYVLVYLMVGLLWPWEPTRFVAPLILFIYGYLFFEIGLFARALQKFVRGSRVLRVAVFVMMTFFILWNIVAQVRHALKIQTQQVPSDWSALYRLFDWLRRETEPSSVLAALNDVQIYLYTGRSTIRELGSANALRHYGVEYIVLVPYGGVMTSGDLSQMRFAPLLQKYPDAFTRVYFDEPAGIQVFRIRQNELLP